MVFFIGLDLLDEKFQPRGVPFEQHHTREHSNLQLRCELYAHGRIHQPATTTVSREERRRQMGGVGDGRRRRVRGSAANVAVDKPRLSQTRTRSDDTRDGLQGIRKAARVQAEGNSSLDWPGGGVAEEPSAPPTPKKSPPHDAGSDIADSMSEIFTRESRRGPADTRQISNFG